jgi:hypothetical protein
MKWRTRVSKAALTIFLICMTFACCAVAATTSYGSKMYFEKNKGQSVRSTIEELAISNPDSVYFYSDLHCCYSITFPHYEERLPTNVLYWGGAYYLLEPYDHQLQCNGIESFDVSLFLQNNVFFINDEQYRTNSNAFQCLTDYLKEKYGEVTETRICALDQGSVTVYHFSVDSEATEGVS